MKLQFLKHSTDADQRLHGLQCFFMGGPPHLLQTRIQMKTFVKEEWGFLLPNREGCGDFSQANLLELGQCSGEVAM